jgi:hypothetical protein
MSVLNYTFSAQNNITTKLATSVFIQGSPNEGPNSGILQGSALCLGYVNNVPGGYLSGQILFQSANSQWTSSVFTDQNNKLIIANAVPGAGTCLYTNNGEVTLETINSVSDTTNTPFLRFTKNYTSIYATQDSGSNTGGAISCFGGANILKNTQSQTFSISGKGVFNVTEGSTVNISNTVGIVIIKATSTIANLNITLPVSTSVQDSRQLRCTTNTTINNISLTNCIVNNISMNPVRPLSFCNVLSDNTWYFI